MPKKTRASRKPKVPKSPANEDVAVKCCSFLKKSLSSGDYSDWDEIGSGENCKCWMQIKGVIDGNNIVVSKEGEGRKKRYTVYILSTQGTEINCEFDTFTYKHSDGKLILTFTYSDKMKVEHSVKYGELNE